MRLPMQLSVVRRITAGASGAAIVATILLGGACRGRTLDASIVLDSRAAMNPRVTNGAAYDVAELPVAGFAKIRIPTSARVRVTGPGSVVRVYMEKAVWFGGHPPKPIDPLTARRAMGCAWKAQGDTVILGSFGEWANMEGSAAVGLLLDVPSALAVETSRDLAGSNSSAALQEPLWWRKVKRDDPSYWYAASVPALEWTALPSQPDPKRQAKGTAG